MRRTILSALLAAAAIATPMAAQAEVRVTEFMYQGASSGLREFIELTNISNSSFDITGWSYNDDNPNNPVNFGSSFGVLAANESIILTEMTATDFRTYWGLAASVRVFSIGGNSNLGNGDTINIYNSSTQTAATLVDTLTFPSATAGVSRNRPVGVTGAATNAQFVNSAVGDAYGSHLAPTNPADLANPGSFPVAAAVPEPASWAMMIMGMGAIGAATRRRRRWIAFA
jgi:hypothetical protein